MPSDVHGRLYPAIGLACPGARIRASFNLVPPKRPRKRRAKRVKGQGGELVTNSSKGSDGEATSAKDISDKGSGSESESELTSGPTSSAEDDVTLVEGTDSS